MTKFLMIFIFPFALHAQYKGHGVDSVSTENLKKYAPESLNPEMTNKLRKMLDISSPGMGILSPNKKTLYFTWKVTGINQVWKIDGPQKFPVQLTSGMDSVSLKDISPDGKFLIISKDMNGQENPGLYKLDLLSGKIIEIYRKEKAQVSYSFMTSDSKYIYYSSNDVKSDSYNIYKINLLNNEKQLIYEGEGYWGIADQRKDGKELLLYKAKGSKAIEYYDYNPDLKKLTPVIGLEEEEEYDVTYSTKRDEYLVLYPKDDFKRLYLYTPKISKDLKLITDPKLNYDISSFSIDKKRTRIIYNINREGYTEMHAIDAKMFKPIQIPKFKNADHIFSGITTDDGQITMVSVITSQAPRTSYSYNWKTKQLTQWVLPSAPEVNLSSFSVAELMFYQTRDNVKIPMFVRFPKGCKEKKNCPVVVHFHGGPEAQSNAGFSSIAQAFVDEGFIFVEPNVRGSDGYGKAWVNMDNGAKREKVITDIEDASVWIKKNWISKDGVPPKVGVMGWSYGGYSTLMAMSRFAGSYEAGVALVGMSNLISFLNNTAPYRRVLRISEYGDPVKDKEALMRLSPITYVDQIKDPLMIIQGANDPRVPVGEAMQIYEIMQKKKIKSKLIIFADEGHGSSKKENQILEIGHTINFFKTYLNQ